MVGLLYPGDNVQKLFVYLHRIYHRQHDLSQDSDLVYASSLPPFLVKSNCVIFKENSGIISPLFPTMNGGDYRETERAREIIILKYLVIVCISLGSPLNGGCVQSCILCNFIWVVNFLYPIGFSLGGELVIFVCESYFLFFFHPLF